MLFFIIGFIIYIILKILALQDAHKREKLTGYQSWDTDY